VYQNELKGETNNSFSANQPNIVNTNTIGQYSSFGAKEDPTVRPVPLSFVPNPTTSHLVPMEGDVSHPERHLLTNTEFVSPTKTQPAVTPPEALSSQEDFHEMEQAKKGYTPITRVDEEAMKFYVAGIGVVSLLILYKMMY
jgi:hypothetical protein